MITLHLILLHRQMFPFYFFVLHPGRGSSPCSGEGPGGEAGDTKDETNRRQSQVEGAGKAQDPAGAASRVEIQDAGTAGGAAETTQRGQKGKKHLKDVDGGRYVCVHNNSWKLLNMGNQVCGQNNYVVIWDSYSMWQICFRFRFQLFIFPRRAIKTAKRARINEYSTNKSSNNNNQTGTDVQTLD